MDVLKVKKVREGAKLPVQATGGAAGFDVCACIDEKIVMAPGGRALVPTGISIEVPYGCAAFCFARSGLAIKHGICLSNGVGVIDSDYRGEVMVGLVNLGSEEYVLEPGERMAQIAIMEHKNFEIQEADDLSETERGKGGFGSTGRN